MFKPNSKAPAAWKAAVQDLAAITKKTNPEGVQQLVKQSARRFVRNAADVTPPASGKANAAAKKRGEGAVMRDLLKIAIPTSKAGVSRKDAKEYFSNAAQLLAEHAKEFAKGSIAPRRKDARLTVSNADFNRAKRKLTERVGWLAAGLNAAAEKLGFKLPLWIKRHGSKYGKISVKETATGIRVRIVQNVPYANRAPNYERRWDFALNKEISTLAKMVKANVARAAARAAKKIRR